MYIQTAEDYPTDDIFESVTIDGYPAEEDDEHPGEVVAVVYITTHGDILVDWHLNGYRLNEEVLSLIKDSKELLRGDYQATELAKTRRDKATVKWLVKVECHC